jgi:hypothetical protein
MSGQVISPESKFMLMLILGIKFDFGCYEMHYLPNLRYAHVVRRLL